MAGSNKDIKVAVIGAGETRPNSFEYNLFTTNIVTF